MWYLDDRTIGDPAEELVVLAGPTPPLPLFKILHNTLPEMKRPDHASSHSWARPQQMPLRPPLPLSTRCAAASAASTLTHRSVSAGALHGGTPAHRPPAVGAAVARAGTAAVRRQDGKEDSDCRHQPNVNSPRRRGLGPGVTAAAFLGPRGPVSGSTRIAMPPDMSAGPTRVKPEHPS